MSVDNPKKGLHRSLRSMVFMEKGGLRHPAQQWQDDERPDQQQSEHHSGGDAAGESVVVFSHGSPCGSWKIHSLGFIPNLGSK